MAVWLKATKFTLFFLCIILCLQELNNDRPNKNGFKQSILKKRQQVNDVNNEYIEIVSSLYKKTEDPDLPEMVIRKFSNLSIETCVQFNLEELVLLLTQNPNNDLSKKVMEIMTSRRIINEPIIPLENNNLYPSQTLLDELKEYFNSITVPGWLIIVGEIYDVIYYMFELYDYYGLFLTASNYIISHVFQ